MENRNLRKERIGVVSSNKGDKTITVTVKWKEKHPIYGKFVNKTKKIPRPRRKERVQCRRHRAFDGNPSSEQDQTLAFSRNNRKS